MRSRGRAISPTADQASYVIELGPQAIARGIATRLARLPGEAAQLLRAAATLGDRTELPLAAVLADLEPKVALSAASALVRADLLRHENPLEFIHPVVRTAVLEGMSAAERMRAHRRAAEALLERGALPEQAAAHLLQTIPVRRPVRRRDAAAARRSGRLHTVRRRRRLRTCVARSTSRLRTASEVDVLGELGIAETHSDVIGAAARSGRLAR